MYNESWGDNITLIQIEYFDTIWAEDRKAAIVDSVRMTFSFYDCTYNVNVNRKDLQDECPIIPMDGDSRLFESFQELIVSESYWPKVNQAFERYAAYYDKYLGEGSEVSNV
jgi:hypothetical protein